MGSPPWELSLRSNEPAAATAPRKMAQHLFALSVLCYGVCQSPRCGIFSEWQQVLLSVSTQSADPSGPAHPAVLTAEGAPQLPKRPTMPDLYGATPKSLQALRPSVKLSPDDASTGDSSQPSNPEPSDP